jgi:SAM-dependent methyltransferase
VQGGCCGRQSEKDVSLGIGYSAQELGQVPAEANLGLGCGAPIGLLGLAPGETVLDLGSGAGLDAFLAARQVGPTGRVIGVDMTPEMLAKARANAAQLGLAQVEFREGRLEALPVADGSVDAVTSNCVINLVPDKSAVFAEIARVLKPGGRLVISDIVLDGELPAAIAQDVYAWCGCVAGADRREDYFGRVRAAGLGQVEVLGDTDYVATMAATAPEELAALTRRLGVEPQDVVGKVRSVTYRARKA